MRLFDVQHPWFIPLYRRIIVVVLLLGWTVFEFLRGSPFWGVLFGGLGLYCAHQFFIAFDPPKPKEDPPPDSDRGPE
jgi:hypothetical protein